MHACKEGRRTQHAAWDMQQCKDERRNEAKWTFKRPPSSLLAAPGGPQSGHEAAGTKLRRGALRVTSGGGGGVRLHRLLAAV